MIREMIAPMRSRRVTWTRVVSTVLVVLAGSAGVAGCTSGSAKPPTASVTSSSASSTATVPIVTAALPTPTPTVPADVPRTGRNLRAGEQPPVMPVLATTHSDAGAKAFVTFFMQTWDWGYATTSGAYMRHYFTAACTRCSKIARILETSRAKRYEIHGGRFSNVLARPDYTAATRPGTESVWQATFDQAADTAYDASGKLLTTDAAAVGTKVTLYVGWSNRWQVIWADVS